MLDFRAPENFAADPEAKPSYLTGESANFDSYRLEPVSGADSPKINPQAKLEKAEGDSSQSEGRRKSSKRDSAKNTLSEFSAALTSQNAAVMRDELQKQTPYNLKINESVLGSFGVIEFKGGVPLDKKLQAAYAEAVSSTEPVSLIHGKHLLHVSPDTDIAEKFEEIRGLDSRRGNKPFHVEETAAERRIIFDGKSIPKQAIKAAIEESRALAKPVFLTVNGMDLGILNGNTVVQDIKGKYDQLRKADASEPAGKSSGKTGTNLRAETATTLVKSEQLPVPITADKAEAAPLEADMHPTAKPANMLPSTIVLPREIALVAPPVEQHFASAKVTASSAPVPQEIKSREFPARRTQEPQFDFDWKGLLHPGAQSEMVAPKSYFSVQPPREMPHDLSVEEGESAKPQRRKNVSGKPEVAAPQPHETATSVVPDSAAAARHIEFDPATSVVNEYKHPSGFSLVRDAAGQSHAESMMQPRYRIVSDKGEQIGIFSGRLAINDKGALHAFPRRSMLGEELTRFDALANDLGLRKSEPGKSLSSYVEAPVELRSSHQLRQSHNRLSGHPELIDNAVAPLMEGYDRRLTFFYPAMDEPVAPAETLPIKEGTQELRPEQIVLRAQEAPKANTGVPRELLEASELDVKSESRGKTNRAAGKAAAVAGAAGVVLSATTQGAQALGILK